MAISLEGLSKSEVESLIVRAQRRLEEIDREKETNFRARVLELARSEGVDLDAVFGGAGKGGKKSRKSAGVKFRDPSNPGNTWSGRGKRPRWFNDALAQGKSQDDLRA